MYDGIKDEHNGNTLNNLTLGELFFDLLKL